MKEAYVIGLDFGTDSVRAIIVNAHTGEEVSNSSFLYRRWKEKLYCDPINSQYRQHPLDYLEGLEAVLKECIQTAGPEVARNIKAIGTDATGSTPVAVNRGGTPLSLLSGFEQNPNAMFVLWKDHTAIKEADEINNYANKINAEYLKYVGGIYSSEWFWAKLLHTLRTDEAVRKECYSWVEQSDWIPFVLTGGSDVHGMKRNRCAAGHKAAWSEAFRGLPPQSFWSSIDPLLNDWNSRLYEQTETSDKIAGNLSSEWAKKLGLSEEVVVTVGMLDAHAGAIGAEVQPYSLCKIMGTSTCDIMVVPRGDISNKCIEGICGQVDGSIVPGMIGLEAGQSAFGDIYAWFQSLLQWPLQHVLDSVNLYEKDKEKLRSVISQNYFSNLEKEAAKLPIEQSSELAIDWFNGRRTPNANQKLKGSLHNLTLGTDAPRIYKALVEATCFGSKRINDCFIEQGIQIKEVIALGGVAKKSPFVMQTLADVLNTPIKVHRSEQSCASGAAMVAVVAVGIYPDLSTAMEGMGVGFEKVYTPQPIKVKLLAEAYQEYIKQGDLQERIFNASI